MTTHKQILRLASITSKAQWLDFSQNDMAEMNAFRAYNKAQQ